MKKQFIAPRITKVVNEELMAEVCNEQFVYTSKGGASAGYAKVCYHWRFSITDQYEAYSLSQYRCKVINIPAGAVFSTTPDIPSGKELYTGTSGSYTSELGWQDFEGLNGTCHFIGDLYINGELITEDNVHKWAAN